jgi:hypothetical protein
VAAASLREKPIKIGAKVVVSHGRYVTLQMAEVAVSRQMFADILSLIARLRAPPTLASGHSGPVRQAAKGGACIEAGQSARVSVPVAGLDALCS